MPGTMRRHHVAGIAFAAALSLGLAGCGSGAGFGGFGGNTGSDALVSLAMTDAAPAGVSVLSFRMTLTSVTLSPGNVSVLSAPVTVEVTRLQTEISLLTASAVRVKPGTYTSASVTVANPMLTFRNDSSGTLTVGGTACGVGSVCSASPTATSLVASATFPGAGVTLTANTPAALLLDVNLASLLTSVAGPPASIQVAADGSVIASQLTPAQTGAPLATFEDVTGVVSAKNTSTSQFTLQTALGNYPVDVTTGASATAFLNFPSCGAADFTCVANGQIVSVDMDLGSDGTLSATRVFFEDASTSLPEIEGIVVATSGLGAPAQFSMVVLEETFGAVPVLGSEINVAASLSESFDVENLGASIDTAAFSFAGIPNVIVGQEVQVQQDSGSTASQINAARVELRSSRMTGAVISTQLPDFTMGTLPPFLGTAGFLQIHVETLSPPAAGAYTEFGGTATASSEIAVGKSISVRGQLFANGATPALVATRVIQH